MFWDKIRILVTNGCNYCCPFCHNEGQTKDKSLGTLSYTHFTKIIDCIKDQNISEICFSGGEPFLHPEIVKMIQYANDHTKCEIGCATNLFLITDNQISQLSSTRIKLNIQFPFVDRNKFKISTGNGNFDYIIDRIQAVRKAGIAIGLNSVIQSSNMEPVKEMIEFALENELPLKLLPQIGLEESFKFKEQVFPILKTMAIDFVDKKSGATRWTIQKNGKITIVLYIEATCFTKDIIQCRNYGELRIHPNLNIQPCILKESVHKLEIDNDKKQILNQLRNLWNNFNQC